MANKRQRAFALTAAVVFLASSVAFSGLVIYQMIQSGKDENSISKEQQQIEEQLTSSKGKQMENFQPVASVTELQKIDLVVGEGQEAKESDTVTVHYIGATAKDGKIFESSYDVGQPVTFALNQVIPGWTQGVPGMKVGGKRRLLIPSALAYGEQGAGTDIAPNSDLVFDIELVAIPAAQ